MCGIFGWAGKNPKQFDKTKLDVLGIFNETRGVHSCGIAIDGEISIGIDKNKIYRDFLTNVGYTAPTTVPVVLGHTRQSTYGAHTIENAHPFGFGNLNDNYEFIGVHNGTLLNHKDLAKEYGIDHTAEVNHTPHYSTSRDKIDSEIILEIISKTKNYKVLSSYNGAAALVWQDLNQPNVLYCFHGKSKKRDVSTSEVEEERPLFFYQEKKNSLYISSLAMSLKAIGGTDKTIFAFAYNTIYKITDGDVSTAVKTTISRNNNFQTGYAIESVKKSTPITSPREGANHERYTEWDENERWARPKNTRTELLESSPLTRKGEANIDPYSNLYTESPLENVATYGSRIYFNKLRYWRNGHLINGCYCFIPNFGFYYLGDSPKAAETRFYDHVNKYFYKGDFTENLSKKEKEAAIIPFVHKTGMEIVNPPIFFMYDGIKVKNKFDYLACLDMDLKQGTPFTYDQLSHCASHPILDLHSTYKDVNHQAILFEGIPVTDTICPLGSEKIYEIINGNCVDYSPIKDVQRKENVKTVEENIPYQQKLELVVNNLQKIENDIAEKEKKVEDAVIIESDNDLLEEDLNDMLTESLRRFPNYIKRLRSFENEEKAKRAANIMEVFLKKATNLVTLEKRS